MTLATFTTTNDVERAVASVAHDLVRVHQTKGGAFLNLPILYPDGSSVTVKVDQIAGGIRVSDSGFAYREAEDANALRSFDRSKKSVAEEFGVLVGTKTFYVDATADTLFGAVCDVAAASWQIVSRIYSRISDDDEVELVADLGSRLKHLFGATHVQENQELPGASSVGWQISALVSFNDHQTVFQAVSEHPNSINRSATAFRDLSALPKPPKLVAVVRNLTALGPRLTLLTQASARVIERSSPDDMWKLAA